MPFLGQRDVPQQHWTTDQQQRRMRQSRLRGDSTRAAGNHKNNNQHVAGVQVGALSLMSLGGGGDGGGGGGRGRGLKIATMFQGGGGGGEGGDEKL